MKPKHVGEFGESNVLVRFLLLNSLLAFGLLSLMLGVVVVSASAIVQLAGIIGGIVDGFVGNLLAGVFSALVCLVLVFLALILEVAWGRIAWLLWALLGLLLSEGVL